MAFGHLPYRDYFVILLTKLLQSSNSLVKLRSSPLFWAPCAHGHWPKGSFDLKRGAGLHFEQSSSQKQFREMGHYFRTGFLVVKQLEIQSDRPKRRPGPCPDTRRCSLRSVKVSQEVKTSILEIINAHVQPIPPSV